MRVVHLANFDGKGPALAAFRLHQALLRRGVDSRMLVPDKRTEEPTVELYPVSRTLTHRIGRRIRQARIRRAAARYRHTRPPGLEDFSDDRSVHGRDLLHHLFTADVVNVHALRAFADYGAFFRVIPQHAAVVRTMHDMNFFTGGCHAAEGCKRYLDHCGACPQLGSRLDEDLSRQIWRRKKRALDGVRSGRVHLVAPSQWLAAQARKSTLAADLPITVIPHGVDLDVFQPRDRQAARQALGLAPAARVVLFVAEPISRRLKGFTLLAEALGALPDRDTVTLIAVGSGPAPIEPSVHFLQTGYVADDRRLSEIYAAADLFVIPSSMESFGLTALQAISCGTPVIGFEVGAIPELVRPDITGLLAAPQDAAALGKSIAALLDDPERRRRMSENCRQIALREYSLDLHVNRYVELYESMVAPSPSRRR